MSDITRRDFVNGTLVVAGTSMLPFGGMGQAAMAAFDPSYYPPKFTGLRGSHPGSNEHAHARAWEQKTDWGATSDLSETYDLVVVGGGISGLAAAYFYQREHGKDKKVLILENHDDFGGHAKRNEHDIDGDIRLGEGGSESIESPYGSSELVMTLFEELGIDLDRFKTAYDANFFKKHNLGAVTYFNKEKFGEDMVVKHPFCEYPAFVEGLMRPTLPVETAVAQTPLSASGKEQLLRVIKGGQHDLNIPKEDLPNYIKTHSYFDYLQNTLGIDDPDVLRMARHTSVDYTEGGTDVLSISEVLESGPLGINPLASWKDAVEGGAYQTYLRKNGDVYSLEEPFIHHFPDGNATIARLLVKNLIPTVGPGNNAEEIILSKFDYSELDKPGNSARLRLNSTVVNVKHDGDPNNASEVSVNYINDNKPYQVKAKSVVMACYNMIIPHIVPGLPRAQDAAFRGLTKVPLQYTTVGVKNWRAMKEMGIGMAMCPGNMHQVVGMDFPVSMGGYGFTKTPDDPCVLHFRSAPLGETIGAPAIEQFREVRYRMLGLSFDDYEAEIRSHLSGMFPKELFNFDRDVQSISVNRWAHGYSHGDPGDIGRQPFGRITIANSDANDTSLVQSAIEQAHRAVQELK